MDVCIGTIVWYLWGYTVAYGTDEDSNDFIGVGDMAINESENWTFWFFSWTFACTAATIVSGSMAERCSFLAYGVYTVLVTSWVYPCVAHWVWDRHGWLSPQNKDISAISGGVIDFAGSGVVHIVGGWSGLVGAYLLGPRLGRFRKKDDSESNSELNSNFNRLEHEHKFGNNVSYQVMGMFFLWVGFYAFNCM